MTNQDKQVVLKVNNLKQYFVTGTGKYRIYNPAVNDISFEVKRGEVFSLVGESGCGKTTTGRTIMRLYKPTDGEVYLLGKRICAGFAGLKKDIKNKRKQIRNLKANNASAEEIQKLESEIINLKEEIKQRKIDQGSKYRPSKEEIQAVKEENKVLIEAAKKELEEINAEIANLKNIIFKKLDDNKDKLNDNEQVKLHAELLEKYREERSKLRRKKSDKEYDISRLSTLHLFYARPLLNKIQMIFQDPIDSLDPRMTVHDIIAEGLHINKIKNPTIIKERVYEALKKVGLMPEHASHFPHEFSGGQRQRVGIARAIVCEPEVIVADEPISALDVSIQAQVINLLNNLKEELGLTILFIAHDLSVVKYFSDQIAIMYYGHIVEMGDKKKVFDNPLHPYTKALISSIPLPDPDYERERGEIHRYNPNVHNYQPGDIISMKEVERDHYVMCNDAEFEAYKKIVSNEKNKK